MAVGPIRRRRPTKLREGREEDGSCLRAAVGTMVIRGAMMKGKSLDLACRRWEHGPAWEIGFS
jgi:hypothetical protein